MIGGRDILTLTGMFDSERYLGRLAAGRMGRRPSILAETDSTNDWISRRLNSPDADTLVAVAEIQTKGRGRRGREWITCPFVNIAASVAWPVPEKLKTMPGLITLSAGLALAEAVLDITSVPAKIKYPNDLVIRGRKAGGILSERKTVDGVVWAVIGFGVNVNTEEWMFPEGLQGAATSLLIENGGIPVSREESLALILTRLESALEGLSSPDGAQAVLSRSKALSSVMGRTITVVEGSKEISGKAVDLGDDGSLVLLMADGTYRNVMTGETEAATGAFRVMKEA